MRGYTIMLYASIFLASCVPASDEVITEVNLDLSNPEFTKAYDIQDKQLIDSLLAFVNHEDPSLRFISANAFASIEAPSAIDSIAKLLSDASPKVRQAAVYALGQQRDVSAESHLLGALQLYDSISYNNQFNSSIMEAVGKVGTEANLNALATAANIRSTDNEILLGQVRGIYRYLLRGITSNAGTSKMIEIVSDRTYTPQVRTIAANYLSRAAELDIESSKFQLSRAMMEESDPNIKMALVYALRHTKDPEILSNTLSVISGDEDYRVKVNAISTLSKYEYIDIIEKILEMLNDKNRHVANAAADYLINHGQPADASLYANYVKDEMHWSTKAKIYEGVLKQLPRNYANTRFKINAALTKGIKASTDPYEKAAYFNSLAADVVNFKIIHDLGVLEKSPIVKTAIASGYQKILTHPQFDRAYRSKTSQKRTKTNIAKYLEEAIASGGSGAVSIAAKVFADKNIGYQELELDQSFLDAAITKLSLPKETEVLYALKEAIANLSGTSYTKEVPVHNHPIDWSLLDGIRDSTVVNIITDKGNIQLKLFTKEAPGTVANFIQLANSNFYDGKVFHRVVPGFVIQGGCPIGDGYGSLDYSIRSEFSQLYYDKPGKIGMASSGSHTEGVQFFITQAPAPHLDGRYTIFGEVISGMQVVHDIQVGDQITDVQILK